VAVASDAADSPTPQDGEENPKRCAGPVRVLNLGKVLFFPRPILQKIPL